MSSDNGVYIGSFPLTDKSGAAVVEYRVIDAQAIENCDFGDIEEQDNTRVCYYSKAPVFATLEEAEKEADRLLALEDICEYGICYIEYDRPLINKSVEEAGEWLDEKWDFCYRSVVESNGFQYQWQTPEKKHIKRGVVLFATKMQTNGGAFVGHTVLKLDGDDVVLARPMAWAAMEYDSNQPMLSCEVYSVSIKSICTEHWKVWLHTNNGEPHTMMT